LKERFNISEEALDLFRVSNRILMTCIEMSLNLYDIATMCCRNNNGGMVKSHLEKITSQAAELASVAVENGRWHHSAASRALEDQLQVEHIPHLNSVSKKSKSMVDFASLLCEHTVPSRMVTSGSESGSDIGDGDQDHDECEKWAALIIAGYPVADLQVDDDDDNCSDRSLSSSYDSSSSSLSKLSSSPTGFWHVRPGSNVVTTDNNHSWSPSTSPVNSILLNNTMLRYNSSISSKRDNSVAGNGVFIVDSLIVENVGLKSCDTSTMVKKKSTGMVRSQSFTALSSKPSIESVPVSGSGLSYANTLGRVDEDYEQYHVYFLKFIDLLVEREIRARSMEIGNY